MQDERDTPQDENAEEVEAHRLARLSEEPGVEQDDDDEVEAHRLRQAPPEAKRWEPSE